MTSEVKTKRPRKPRPSRAGAPSVPSVKGHVPDMITRKKVKEMSIAGISHDRIAQELGIYRQALVRYYPEELKFHSKSPHPDKYVPTAKDRKLVEEMKAAGVKEDTIADCLDIGKHTLHAHFKRELATATARMNKDVAMVLFEKATDPRLNGPSVAAAIAWLKYRAGWGRDEDNAPLNNADENAMQKNGRAMGKKELAHFAAKTAGLNSEWGNDLHVGARRIEDDKDMTDRGRTSLN